jgi:hypothetical protein
MNFGLTQWTKIVPPIVRNIKNALNYFLAGTVAFTPILAPKFNVSGEDFAMWTGLGMLAVNGFAKLFGISDEEALEVYKDKIKKIEEKTKTD